MGILQTTSHFIKYGDNGIGQLKLWMWSDIVKLVKLASLMDQSGSIPISGLFSVLHLGLWSEWIELNLSGLLVK